MALPWPPAASRQRSLMPTGRRHTSRPKYSARAFYLTLLVVAAFTVFSFLADIGNPQSRAGSQTSLHRRDVSPLQQKNQEVGCAFDSRRKSVQSKLTVTTVPPRPPCDRQMRLRTSELPRRGSWHLLLPHPILLPHAPRATHRIHHNGTMAWFVIQHNRYSGQRLLLRQSQHHFKPSGHE